MPMMTPDGLLFERRPVDMFNPGRIPALLAGTCATCGQSVLVAKADWSEVERSEYLISATCPPCWYDMMGSSDDEDEDEDE